MKKVISRINIEYTYNENWKGNKYHYKNTTMEQQYFNGGDFAELIRKAQLNLTPEVDRTKAFNEGCDIEEYKESVKSARADFTGVYLGEDYETIWNNYFKQDKAERYSYITWDNENVIAYVMSTEEFKEFAREFTSLEKCTKRIRFRTETKKMLKWLNARAE